MISIATCYIKAITGLDMLASWVLHWFDWATLMVTWGHLGHVGHMGHVEHMGRVGDVLIYGVLLV